MKWKRSKKAQQEARSKNGGDSKHRNRNSDNNTSDASTKNNFENKNNETEDEDLDIGDEDLDEEIEDEEEELDVGEGEHKDISHLLPHFNSAPLNSAPSGAPPPLHLSRDALPGLEGLHNNTNLSSMLPPHLARMGAGPNSRFYRPFVA